MTPKGKRILVGLLLAVGCFAAIVIGFIVSFVVWVSRPGEPIEPQRLLSADATGYAEWTLRAEDPGTEGFLRHLIEVSQNMPPEVEQSLPPGVSGWIAARQNARGRRSLERGLPAVATWTLRPAADGASGDLHLVGVSGRGLGNQIVLADWIASFALRRAPNASVNPYHGENIYQWHVPRRDLDELALTFFARQGAVFATSDLDTARQAVDLLAESAVEAAAEAEGEATPRRPASELETLLATTPLESPLRAAVVNGHDELAHLWETVSQAPVSDVDGWGQIEAATLMGGLQADGAFEGVMMLQTTDPATAAAYAPLLAPAFQEYLARFSVDAEIAARVDGARVQVDVRVSQLVESFSEWMRRQQNRPNRRPRRESPDSPAPPEQDQAAVEP